MVISLLNREHDRNSFDCGDPDLNFFIKNLSSSFLKRNLCGIHILQDDNDPCKILGYYAIAPMSVEYEKLPPNIKKKYPPQMQMIPAFLLGKLAVREEAKGKGLGEILLMDALSFIAEESKRPGGAFVMVDAKNENAQSFYKKYGFISFPDNQMRLFLPIKTIPL
jgi:predicted GNAT family N-acyltransferase